MFEFYHQTNFPRRLLRHAERAGYLSAGGLLLLVQRRQVVGISRIVFYGVCPETCKEDVRPENRPNQNEAPP